MEEGEEGADTLVEKGEEGADTLVEEGEQTPSWRSGSEAAWMCPCDQKPQVAG